MADDFETNGMKIVERIDSILKQKGKTRVDLANSIGIKPQNISAWSTRGTIPAGDICLKIASYLNVSIEWLITGIEKTYTKEELELLSRWKELDFKEKSTVAHLLDSWQEEKECDCMLRIG